MSENVHGATTRAQSRQAPAPAHQILRACTVERHFNDFARHEDTAVRTPSVTTLFGKKTGTTTKRCLNMVWTGRSATMWYAVVLCGKQVTPQSTQDMGVLSTRSHLVRMILSLTHQGLGIDRERMENTFSHWILDIVHTHICQSAFEPGLSHVCSYPVGTSSNLKASSLEKRKQKTPPEQQRCWARWSQSACTMPVRWWVPADSSQKLSTTLRS